MDRQLSATIVQAELQHARKMGEGLWAIQQTQEEPLKFCVVMDNRSDGEKYVLDFNCEEYKEKPPFIEMIDVRSGQRGTPSAYPAGNSFFNSSQYFICNYFNRKSYRDHTSLHTDWQYDNWIANAKGYSTIGDMLSKIYIELQSCKGRLG
ncbi:hypothetical protein MJA45_18695 [Paenibacillus aurantius]|uniref:Uncharacterized protein n=1 Tax=Paenibacillus aurantius TaxID=2918900 RepID=A0AA96LDD0_9BACL|nr:hypothetical protein [Paenibacillus aurantius]WNQ09647.1 hypothetical protein MJA45_18695 [Paenibacillus aurantius]